MAESNFIRPIWERQPGESARAFQGFAAYRDMGPGRSVAKVGQKLGKSATLLERWSALWRWVVRAEVWDMEQQRTLQEQTARLRVEAVQRHQQEGQALQEAARGLLEGLKSPKNGHAAPAHLQAASTALAQGVKLERVALGLPTVVTTREAELRQTLERSIQGQEQLIAIVREHICATCYERVRDDLLGIMETHGEARKLIAEVPPHKASPGPNLTSHL